MLMEIKNSQFN